MANKAGGAGVRLLRGRDISLGSKPGYKKPKPNSTQQTSKGNRMLGKNEEDTKNMFTDSEGNRWEIPIGELMKNKAKLEQLNAVNDKEAMMLEQKRIEQQMMEFQAQMMEKEEIRQAELSATQSMANARNWAAAMFGNQGGQQMPQAPASIYGDMLQSQSGMAQNQLQMLENEKQRQSQSQLEALKNFYDAQQNREEFKQNLGLEEYKQGEMNKRAMLSAQAMLEKQGLMNEAKSEGKTEKELDYDKLVKTTLDKMKKNADLKRLFVGMDADISGVESAPIVKPAVDSFIRSALNNKLPDYDANEVIDTLEVSGVIDENYNIDEEALYEIVKELNPADAKELVEILSRVKEFTSLAGGGEDAEEGIEELYKKAVRRGFKF